MIILLILNGTNELGYKERKNNITIFDFYGNINGNIAVAVRF